MLPSIFGENLFDEFFGNAFDNDFWSTQNPLYGKRAKNLMKTDVKEEEDAYSIAIDLPGFDKDNVQAHLEDGYLTVTANKSSEQDEKNEKDQKGRYIRQERYSGSCSRSFYVGDIRPDEVKCSYESGVLRIRIPTRDMQLPEGRKQIAIE